MNRTDKNTLPPDLYSRNTVIGFIAEKLLLKGEMRVLDVGGYGGKLHWFLPENAKLTILDKKPGIPDEGTEYHEGDARKIPYSDRNFDLVISTDLLEHVDISERAPVIREMLRVTKKHLILGVPCRAHITETAENHVMEQFRDYMDAEHPFLKEHRETGLPEEEKIEAILMKEGVDFFKIKEGNLMNWYIQQLYAGIQHGKDVTDAKFGFYHFFNENLYELGNLRAPVYRTIFVIARDGTLPKTEIQDELLQKHVWNPEKFMELLRMAFNDLKLIMDEKKERLVHLEQTEAEKLTILMEREREVREWSRKYEEEHARAEHAVLQTAEKDTQLLKLEERIEKARKSIEAHREAIMDVRNFLQEKEKTLQMVKAMLQEKESELAETENERSRLKKLSEEQDRLLKKMGVEVNAKNEELDFLNKHVRLQESLLDEMRGESKERDARLRGVESDLARHQEELRKVANSRAWKTVLAYGKVKNAVLIRPVALVKKALDIWKTLGFGELVRRIRLKLKAGKGTSEPSARAAVNRSLGAKDRQRMEKEIAGFAYKPRVSIVVPVYNVEEKWLRKAIESVKKQVYPKWELCLCDDASSQEHIKPLLEKFAEDRRIKVCYRQKNGGIVKATNDALKLASGAYVGFLDNDDELTEDALYEVVKALQEAKYEVLYSDEDKLDAEGNQCDPFYKPDWSPDLLFSQNYICHFAVYRRKVIEEAGLLREGFDGSQDYDLILRVTEKTQSIKHIQKILYHWRKIPGSTAAEIDAKPYAFDSARKALEYTLKKRGIDGGVSDGIWTGSYRVKRAISGRPLVSIIIPFKDRSDVLATCVESILAKSTYENYEIILVDNRSEKLETADYLRSLKQEFDERKKEGVLNAPKNLKILQYDAPFNFSAINNFALKFAEGEVLMLLNNDTEVITPEWIESMLEHAQRPEVGAVGAKLLFPNGLVQHAGVLIGVGGLANHAFLKQMKEDHGYFGQADVIRNYSAVTGACMMVRKEVYEKMGGLNESDLGVGFNDVDFCLRLREKGYLIVYTPYARLVHYESLSRGYDVNLNEVQYIRDRHNGVFKKGDPYYNPNLTHERFDFSFRWQDALPAEK